MYREIPRLVMFRQFGEDSILMRLAAIMHDFDENLDEKENLISRIYEEIRALLEVSTDFAFDKNLWHDYLTYLLITNENPFTMTAEKVGASNGSVNQFAKNDMRIFCRLYNYDFDKIEEALGIDCFTTVTHYHSISKKEQMFNRNISEKVLDITERLEAVFANEGSLVETGKKDEKGQPITKVIIKDDVEAKVANEMFAIITDFYHDYGVGMFGLNKAFRIRHEDGHDMEILPITSTEYVKLDDLVGYEVQKQELRENTEAFVQGRPANNCLLYGDAGTGKSTSIKALINEYYDQGLRMIEIYKHQFKDLSRLISIIKNRNYRFIIYMDDLSFEDFEIEYKYLKAVIEGGLEVRPDNVLIYATSNRRHLIRESWKDKSDMSDDLHHSDTVEEKLSLSSRFGCAIRYINPDKKEFNQIIMELASRCPEIKMTEEELIAAANQWEIYHGGMSGRTAQQFIDSLRGKVATDAE